MMCHDVKTVTDFVTCAQHCVTTYGPWVVTAASAASAVLPKAPAGSAIAVVQQVIGALAINFGHAKDEHK